MQLRLSLAELDRRFTFLSEGRTYHGEAVNPKNLSIWEKMMRIGRVSLPFPAFLGPACPDIGSISWPASHLETPQSVSEGPITARMSPQKSQYPGKDDARGKGKSALSRLLEPNLPLAEARALILHALKRPRDAFKQSQCLSH